MRTCPIETIAVRGARAANDRRPSSAAILPRRREIRTAWLALLVIVLLQASAAVAAAAGPRGREPGLLRRSALSNVPLLRCASRREGRLTQGRRDLSGAGQGQCARGPRRESNPHWGLTKDFKLEPQRAGKKAGWRKVAIRFRADDHEGDWRVDDSLIDPRMRG
jgi:hypothetical protein